MSESRTGFQHTSRYMSFLDSSHTYSAADYPRQKMLLWKFYKMAWTTHVGTNVPAPSWVVHPARFTLLHPQLTELTPAMVQALGQQRNGAAESITATIDDRIVTERHMPRISRGPRYRSILPKLDREGATWDTPAKQFREYVCY